MTLNELIKRVPEDLRDCQLLISLPHPDDHSESDEWVVDHYVIDQLGQNAPTIVLGIRVQ